MSQHWENAQEMIVDATPEQVWDAIATGPGIDSWYMGRSTVQPGDGGTVATDLGPFAMASRISVWEPGRHLRFSSEEAPDGGFIAFEYLIEGRVGGSTVLRTVASGFLPGDDWEVEYDAMLRGGAMYQQALAQYLTHFPGRTAYPVTAMGPAAGDWAKTWQCVGEAFGLPGAAADGDAVRCEVPGIGTVEGVVDYTEPGFLGIRTADALYRFGEGFFTGGLFLGHHVFADPSGQPADEAAWTAWAATVTV